MNLKQINVSPGSPYVVVSAAGCNVLSPSGEVLKELSSGQDTFVAPDDITSVTLTDSNAEVMHVPAAPSGAQPYVLGILEDA